MKPYRSLVWKFSHAPHACASRRWQVVVAGQTFNMLGVAPELLGGIVRISYQALSLHVLYSYFFFCPWKNSSSCSNFMLFIAGLNHLSHLRSLELSVILDVLIAGHINTTYSYAWASMSIRDFMIPSPVNHSDRLCVPCDMTHPLFVRCQLCFVRKVISWSLNTQNMIRRNYKSNFLGYLTLLNMTAGSLWRPNFRIFRLGNQSVGIVCNSKNWVFYTGFKRGSEVILNAEYIMCMRASLLWHPVTFLKLTYTDWHLTGMPTPRGLPNVSHADIYKIGHTCMHWSHA